MSKITESARRMVLGSALVLTLASTPLQARGGVNTSRGPSASRLRVAVYPVSNQTVAVPNHLVTGITEMLISELLKSRKYRVLDRTMVDQVLYEQEFGNSSVARAGTGPSETDNLGAQVIIQGSVTHYTVRSRSRGLGFAIGGVSIGSGGGHGVLGMSVRIIDAATGEVLASGERTAKVKQKDLAVGVRGIRGLPASGLSYANSGEAPLGDVAHDLVGQIVEMLGEATAGMQVATR